LPKTTFRTKIGGGWVRGASKKLGHHVFLQPLKLANSNLVHNLGLGLAYQKNNVYDQNWRGSGPGEHPKIIWDPLLIIIIYLFLQPLKLATANLVHNLGLGLAYQKTTYRTKIGGGLARGALRKNLGPPTYFCKKWDPLSIFATVEASNFEFGTQLGFGTSLPKNNVWDQNWWGSGPGSIQKIGDPLLISATVEANNFKFGIQIWFGTSLPKNDIYDQNWRGTRLG